MTLVQPPDPSYSEAEESRSVSDDRSHIQHDCNPFRYIKHVLTAVTSPVPITVDYQFRCPDCGQRFHITGNWFSQGSERGRASAKPIGGTSRRWRRASRRQLRGHRTSDPLPRQHITAQRVLSEYEAHLRETGRLPPSEGPLPADPIGPVTTDGLS